MGGGPSEDGGVRLDSSPNARPCPTVELAANRVISVPVLRRAGGTRGAATDPTAQRKAVHPGACRCRGEDGDTRRMQPLAVVGTRGADDLAAAPAPTTFNVQDIARGKHRTALRNPASRARVAYPHAVWLRVSGYSAKRGHDNPERFLVAS